MNADDLVLPTTCPWCGKANDRHWSAGKPATPKADDVGICWGCNRAFVFVDDAGHTRRPTAAEAIEIAEAEDVALARAAVRDSDFPDEAVAFTRGVLGGGS